MATTVLDLIYDARALLDSYTDDGVVIAADDLADFHASCIRFADMGQKELYRAGRNQATVEFANRPIENELGTSFEVTEFTGTTQYYPNETGITDIGSYHVQANNTHTIYIEEYESGSWSALATLSGTSDTTYKGNITLTTSTNKVRMRMTGSTYYTHRNRALFAMKFASDSAVPDYAPWVEYSLPSDFYSLERIVEEYMPNQYSQSGTYKFEEPSTLLYDYNFTGTLKIIYNPIPTALTATSDTLEIDDIAAKALSFYVASWISPYENQSMTNPLFQKYAELMYELKKPRPVSEEQIQDYYGGV